MLPFFIYATLSSMNTYRPVAALAVKREDQWLLVRKPRKDHAWQFPQGGVDEGESLMHAAQRELMEECGPDLRVNVFPEPAAEYQYDFPADFLRHHGEFQGAHVTFFYAQWIVAEPVIDNEEVVEARWCTPEEVRELVVPEYWAVVEEFVK